ncbi:DUF5590 domain-containing protein [Caldibacillus lycopersici]|uniref:DUF5590 domain-containing protein n=1 Tax=Perspicuibacillus lycopersici TaxID=1325689 RepID=A0AAE3IU74_9BACI|nr:DUF5590 domain-containing protein [Perspicuibacillus lycopersici]MCU9613683.1 DUF5590 domain-containing protein [Perspicuibacillus lycopersici]
MKQKIIIIVLFLVVIIAIGLVLVYHFSTDDLKQDKDLAVERAKEFTNITTVETIEWFHYIDNYYVIKGKNNKKESIIVWVPDNPKNKEIVVKKAKDGLAEEEVVSLLSNGLDNFSNDKRPTEIIDIKLGMVDNAPAYEITYRDQKNRYSIIYIDFYKGDWYRVYNL